MTRIGTGPKRKHAALICTNSHCDNVSTSTYAIEEEIIHFLKNWLQEEKITFEKNNKKEKTENI